MSDTYGDLVHGIVTCRMGEEVAMNMVRHAARRFADAAFTDDDAVVILAAQGVTWDNVCQMNS